MPTSDTDDGGRYVCSEVFRYLCSEAFESPSGCAALPAHLLRERLPEALRLCEEHERKVNGITDSKELEQRLQNLRDFVSQAETIEAVTGVPVKLQIH